MNFSAPSEARANSHFVPAGKPAPPRPRTSAALTSASSSSGVSSASARRRPDQSPVLGQDRLGEQAAGRRLGGRARRAGEHPLDDAGPGVDGLAVAHGGRGVAEAQADGLHQRDGAVLAALPQPHAEAGGDLVDVRAAGRGEARGPGAHPHMAPAAAHDQVVVERRDPVDRGLREPRLGRDRADVVVGELAARLHGGAQQLHRGGGGDRVVTADQFDEIGRHGRLIGALAQDRAVGCEAQPVTWGC